MSPPNYFNVGSRKGQVLQARLRMECSSLISDLFNCPTHTNVRQTYLPNNLRTYTTKDHLFGSENASVQDNISLFFASSRFLFWKISLALHVIIALMLWSPVVGALSLLISNCSFMLFYTIVVTIECTTSRETVFNHGQTYSY